MFDQFSAYNLNCIRLAVADHGLTGLLVDRMPSLSGSYELANRLAMHPVMAISVHYRCFNVKLVLVRLPFHFSIAVVPFWRTRKIENFIILIGNAANALD